MISFWKTLYGNQLRDFISPFPLSSGPTMCTRDTRTVMFSLTLQVINGNAWSVELHARHRGVARPCTEAGYDGQ